MNTWPSRKSSANPFLACIFNRHFAGFRTGEKEQFQASLNSSNIEFDWFTESYRLVPLPFFRLSLKTFFYYEGRRRGVSCWPMADLNIALCGKRWKMARPFISFSPSYSLSLSLLFIFCRVFQWSDLNQ